MENIIPSDINYSSSAPHKNFHRTAENFLESWFVGGSIISQGNTIHCCWWSISTYALLLIENKSEQLQDTQDFFAFFSWPVKMSVVSHSDEKIINKRAVLSNEASVQEALQEGQMDWIQSTP